MTSTATAGRTVPRADVYDLPGVQPGPGSMATLRPGLGGILGPANQIDDARWVPLGEAPGLLSYEHDQRLLEGGQPAR
jgi:hypothetical protein